MHADRRALQRENRRKREDGKRKSKDKVENVEGKRLMEWIEENGWEVLNGNKQRDEEGEWTYIGSRGETVIDYAIVKEEAWERVEKLTIGERVESDHLPLEIIIVETNHKQRGKRGAREEPKKVTIKVWVEQGVEEYRRRLEKATFQEQDVEKKATTKKEVTVRETKGAGRKNEWSNRECEQLKKEAVKALREWRRNKSDRSRFLEAKRRYTERDVERRTSSGERGRRKR
jgi:hypothetical protein